MSRLFIKYAVERKDDVYYYRNKLYRYSYESRDLKTPHHYFSVCGDYRKFLFKHYRMGKKLATVFRVAKHTIFVPAEYKEVIR